MTYVPSTAWRLALTITLLAAILASRILPAPRSGVPGAELRQLVYASISLYLVGILASASGHPVLATIVYACGIGTCTLAAWLSRGEDSDEGPPGGEDPEDQHPPPTPEGLPEFDWARLEAEFRAESEHRRATPV